MIEMIGLTTFCMLVWVLASSMAIESEAEKRRAALLAGIKASTLFAPKKKTISPSWKRR